jgi:hypothetical protein
MVLGKIKASNHIAARKFHCGRPGCRDNIGIQPLQPQKGQCLIRNQQLPRSDNTKVSGVNIPDMSTQGLVLVKVIFARTPNANKIFLFFSSQRKAPSTRVTTALPGAVMAPKQQLWYIPAFLTASTVLSTTTPKRRANFTENFRKISLRIRPPSIESWKQRPLEGSMNNAPCSFLLPHLVGVRLCCQWAMLSMGYVVNGLAGCIIGCHLFGTPEVHGNIPRPSIIYDLLHFGHGGPLDVIGSHFGSWLEILR